MVIQGRLQLSGQFSAIDQVELRAQVGGTLTHIGFKDGAIVKAGDLLFEIDPTQYQIKPTGNPMTGKVLPNMKPVAADSHQLWR